MLELCMSGKAWRIFLLSSLAQTMKAFIGRLMWGSALLRPRASRYILDSDTLGEPEEEDSVNTFTRGDSAATGKVGCISRMCVRVLTVRVSAHGEVQHGVAELVLGLLLQLLTQTLQSSLVLNSTNISQ